MSQTKPRKQDERESKVSRSEQVEPKVPGELIAASLKWQQEIAGLQNQEFESMALAIDAVSEAVVKRYGGGPETKAFLKSIFDMDPKIQEDLRRALKIAAS